MKQHSSPATASPKTLWQSSTNCLSSRVRTRSACGYYSAPSVHQTCCTFAAITPGSPPPFSAPVDFEGVASLTPSGPLYRTSR
jgi:hypothetical protein